MDDNTHPLRALLAEKLADSLATPFPAATPRRVHGTVHFPGKATAVIGMRRAGKTTFLHQLRQERQARGIERTRLPYINFEDERLGDLQAQDLHLLIEEYYRRFPALFSVEKFYATLKSQGIAISKDTVHQLLGFLEDCFLIRTVHVETTSARRRMVNPRKAYPVDPGLIPVFDRSQRRNLGRLLETAVQVEIERRGWRVSYVRTQQGYEVDFLAGSPTGETALIQVCADLDDPTTREREVRALLAAAVEHPPARLQLITLTPETAHGVPGQIAVCPAAPWFLAPASLDSGS